MHCQKCGKTLKDGETFCSICGYYNSEEDLKSESDTWKVMPESDTLEVEEDDESSEKWFDDDLVADVLCPATRY